MAYAFIHGEVKGSGASVEFKGKAAPAEKKEKPPVGETVGFRMARQFAETEPGFKDFIVALANKLQNG